MTSEPLLNPHDAVHMAVALAEAIRGKWTHPADANGSNICDGTMAGGFIGTIGNQSLLRISCPACVRALHAAIDPVRLDYCLERGLVPDLERA